MQHLESTLFSDEFAAIRMRMNGVRLALKLSICNDIKTTPYNVHADILLNEWTIERNTDSAADDDDASDLRLVSSVGSSVCVRQP